MKLLQVPEDIYYYYRSSELSGLLSGLGCTVYVNGRKRLDTCKAVEKIRAETLNKDVFGANGDISNDDEVLHLYERIRKKHDQIDFLINNAGVYISKPFLDSDYNDIMNPIRTNLLGHINLTLAVSKLMKKNKFGRIVNISSGSGIHGGTLPSFGYAISKNGLNFMGVILAKELRAHGIRINTVVISFMKTDMLKVYEYDYYRLNGRRYRHKSPLDVDYVVNKVINLLNPDKDKANGSIINLR